MSATATLKAAFFGPARCETAETAETGGRPPRPDTGPVLLGDIHGAPNGTPLFLLLWRRWEEEARDDG